jgi:predicted transport protein
MEKAEQTMMANLEKNYGKPLDEWIMIVKDKGLTKHVEILKFLKSEHGFTHGFANLVSLKARGTDAGSAGSDEELVETQYKGKENLKPFYDKLIEEIEGFGSDVEVAPKKAYVSLRRKKQFALIQPSTKSRLDVGINLKGVTPEGRLEASGSFNTMCSHRVRIEEASQVNQQLIDWLREAYEAAG